MINRIFSVVDLKHLWMFLPLLLVFLYGIQAVAGVLVYKNQAASQFVWILSLGIFTYVLTYLSLRKYLVDLSGLERITSAYQLPTDRWIKAISGVYFLLMIYALASAEKVALWEAINGASSTDIAYAREVLFKTRVGWDRSLLYLNALFSTALMPYVLAVCYLERKSYRHILLSLFVISLVPSLEKALVIKAFLPLIIVAFSGYLSRRSGYLFIMLMLIFISGTTYLTKMGRVDPAQESQKNHQIGGDELVKLIQQTLLAKRSEETQLALQIQQAELALQGKHGKQAEQTLRALQAQQALLVQQNEQILLSLRAEQDFQAKVVAKYLPFGVGSQWIFLVNRILWIPYITAYDWLGYFQEKMQGKYLHGRTSMLVSTLSGQTQYPMEKEVFVYQFGPNGPPTAAANATFLVDAFVNFGWIGVALFAAFFATLTRLVDWFDNPAVKACYYYFAYQVAMGGLFGVLFSNGMLVLVILALFMRPSCLPNKSSGMQKAV